MDQGVSTSTASASTASSTVPPLRRGLLLVNLGTPDSPEPGDVRRYLRQFLSDPRVIDLPPLGRWLLLNLVILPFRPRKSSHAYKKIWTPEGSPLLVHSKAFTEGVRKRLGDRMPVELAMRYGNPSIASALDRLRKQHIDELIVFPLYPEAAASTTSSTLDELYRILRESWDVLPVRVVPPFFNAPEFLDTFAQVAREQLSALDVEHVLFSFHGIPERHLKKSDPSGDHCQNSQTCCASLGPKNRGCYRAQCFFVARELAARLALENGSWSVSFQSRLGREEWARPYTDHVLADLGKRGVKKLAVMCPAFVADCLETLEEIALREAETFKHDGGEALHLIRSLNAHRAWVDAAVKLVEKELPARP